MAYVPFSPRIDTSYTFASAYGVATLNADTDAFFGGVATEVTGLDSPEVRESAEDKPQAHGGIHGNFYQGRRPMTFTVRVFNATSVAQRDARIDRLRRATKVYQSSDGVGSFVNGAGTTVNVNVGAPTPLVLSDGLLTWTYDGQGMVVTFRRQQPVRVAGPWVKEVQVAIVSSYNEIFSQNVATVASASGVASANCENVGDEAAYPAFRVTGATTGTTVITHNQTGLKVQMLGTFGLTAGQYVDIDTRNHTVTRGNDGADLTGYIDFANSTWPKVRPVSVTNTFTLTGGGTLNTYWRHAWA